MEYEKIDSEYVSGKDLKGIDGVLIEIITEVKNETGEYGTKPTCKIAVVIGGEKTAKTWSLNNQNMNFLIETFGKDSLSWIGKTVGAFTEEVMGKTAIRIRGTA
jgi:uridylate kinase